MTDRGPTWWHALGRFVIQGVIGAVILLGIVIGLSGPSQQERRNTARNVERLVKESQMNRQISCIAILSNPENPAHDDPRIIDLCAVVGVSP